MEFKERLEHYHGRLVEEYFKGSFLKNNMR